MRYYQLIFFQFLFSLSVLAQQEQIKSKLNEIIVTATRNETSTDEVASSFTIITASQMSNYQKSNVLEFLRDAEGIDITQQGGTGKLASAFIRGSSPSHVLVLIDGIKLNNPSSPNNAFDLSTIMVDFVDRIEIVRGPQSTLYGSEALAGVINIITKEGSTSPYVSLMTEAGSDNFLRGNISSMGKVAGLSYSINFSKLHTDGFSAISSKYGNKEKDAADLTNGLFNLTYKLSDNLSLTGGYVFSNSKTDLDQSNKLGDDPNYTYDYEEHVIKGGLNSDLFDGKLQSRLLISSSRRFTNAIDKEDAAHSGMSSSNYTLGKRSTINFQNVLSFLENQKITLGFESDNESAETSYRSQSQWGPYSSVFPLKENSNLAFYFQDQIRFMNSFFVTAGVRFDKHKMFGNETTYRIAPAYIISATQTKIKATYGTGFKAPSLFYLYDPLFGNKKLQPEKNSGFDFGFEQYLFSSDFSFGVTYFNLVYNNMIGFDQNFKAININKAETKGVELFASYSAGNLSMKLNYTYLNAIDKSPNILKSEQKLIRRPNHKTSFDFTYKITGNISFSSLIRFIGEREDVDYSAFPSQRVKLPSYLLFDFAVGYQLLNSLKLTMRMENAFDKKYEEILFYGTQRRAIFIGANYNFGL